MSQLDWEGAGEDGYVTLNVGGVEVGSAWSNPKGTWFWAIPGFGIGYASSCRRAMDAAEACWREWLAPVEAKDASDG